MRQLNGVYTQKYNWRHGKTGHIFQGRYKSILVEKESYLFELCRYVVLNPVRAKMAEMPSEWKWSSYAATAGFTNVPDYLTVDWILGLFSRKKTTAQREYRKFVNDGIQQGSPWSALQGQILLGEEEFVDKYRDILSDKEKVKEIPRAQRYVSRPHLSRLIPPGEKTLERNKRIHTAHVKHGYTLKEIADHLHIHYTTVSKVVKIFEEK